MSRALSASGVLLIALAVAVAVGCQSSSTWKSAATTVDDSGITASVKTRLVADNATDLTRIDVDTNRGIVYLTGAVDTVEQKARTEQLAWQAKGVKGVVNNLLAVPKR